MRLLYLAILGIFLTSCQAQNQFIHKLNQNNNNTKPKLVVGIVIDQMRYDYLTRFYDKFGEGGFKRLLRGGFNCKNNHYNYIPTYTGPGHASIFTGTTPKYHGIIANNWYDKVTNKMAYCANDSICKPVGTDNEYSKVSPQRMLVTTVTDELRLHTQKRAKVIGIALKDRGAALPAGHMANAAYWFQGEQEGNWVTSSYYMNELPKWVKDFNNSGKAASYFKVWNTLYDINTYTESGADLNTFETIYNTKESATFPYDFSILKENNRGFEIIKVSPFGNALTTDFTIAAIEAEDLGKDTITDFLTISYSSTDYVGHYFGVNSKEVQDTYLRLDKDLERLLNVLDIKVGQGEYTVFLTSDHGAVDVPAYLSSEKIPSGYFNNNETKKKFSQFMEQQFNANDLIKNVSNNQIFLNRKRIKSLGLNLKDVQDAIVEEIMTYKGIDKAYTAYTMSSTSFTQNIELLLQNGFHQKRSGDVIYVYSPNVISYPKTGSTHGSGYNYDTHVPLIFYGKGIVKGSTFKRTKITDIAPTISALLDISFPNGATGNVLDYVID